MPKICPPDPKRQARAPRATKWRQLQSVCWINEARRLCPNLTQTDFAHKILPHHVNPERLVRKWLSGETIAGSHSVESVERRLPGSRKTYDFELFALLDNRPLPLQRIERLLNPYVVTPALRNGFTTWRFPNDRKLKEEGRYKRISWRADIASLLTRTDLYGFMAIVGLVREAEAKEDWETHRQRCAEMVRALPIVARLSPLRDHFQLLSDCVLIIMHRHPFMGMFMDINWDVVKRCSVSPDYTKAVQNRERDGIDLEWYPDVEDPVVFSPPPRLERKKL